MEDSKPIKFYFAYTSPFSFLAWQPACALAQSHRIQIRFIPYGVNIRKVYGDVAGRSERDQNKVRYLYQDARRFAHERGVVILPPRKIYSARIAFYGAMCAEDRGLLRRFSDLVFERFWKRELDVENPDALAAILDEVGGDTAKFRDYVSNEDAEAKPRLKACFAEAERDRIFGVPTFVIDGELFWGHDRLDWVVKKLDALGLRKN